MVMFCTPYINIIMTKPPGPRSSWCACSRWRACPPARKSMAVTSAGPGTCDALGTPLRESSAACSLRRTERGGRAIPLSAKRIEQYICFIYRCTSESCSVRNSASVQSADDRYAGAIIRTQHLEKCSETSDIGRRTSDLSGLKEAQDRWWRDWTRRACGDDGAVVKADRVIGVGKFRSLRFHVP